MLTPFEEELMVGSKFADRYQILSVVGRGSMGVVYKARHELMGRLVAIKMLRGQLQLDERSVKRFEREARAASRLDHPNVIAVHDFGLTDNRQPYLVMDFANGVTLYEIQKRERILNVERAVHIFSQVCDALHHAHLQGVIHRDLKPSNIMVVAKEHDPNFVKVFDLGVAKIAWGEEEEKEAITGTGEVCGSPVYLSPEQCTHDALDHRTDIYSLGVIMYELLTGSPPLMGETVYDTIYLHVHEAPPSFSEVTDAPIPTRLENIVLKALSKNPDERHQSMQELKWDLQACLMQSDPIRVLPPDALRNKKLVAPQRQAEAPESRQKEKETTERTKIIVSDQTQQRMAAYNGSSRMKAATGEMQKPSVPAKAPAGPNIIDSMKDRIKNTNPVVLTAVASSIGTLVITLAVFAALNLGKKPEQAPPVVHTESGPVMETPVSPKQPTIPVASQPKPSSAPPRFSLLTENNEQPRTSTTKRRATHLNSVASVPAIPATTQSPAQSLPQSPANFFSIFMPGKSAATPSAVSNTNKAKLLAKAKSALASATAAWQQAKMNGTLPSGDPMSAPPTIPQQSPNFGTFGALSSGPSPEAQQEAHILNNEAVAQMTSDPTSAVSKLQRALKLDPSYTKAKQNLGRAYHNLANRQRNAGDNLSAINSYRQSLDLLSATLGPTHPDTTLTRQDYESLLNNVGATAN